MLRREFLGGAVGLAVLGAGAMYVSRSPDDEAVQPVEVETLDAPGSEAGTVEVPRRGEVTVVEFFATWCTVCEGMMDDLNEVHDEVGDDARLVSVSNEPVGHTVSRKDVADWWRENDGSWTVGVDPELVLTDELQATGVPTTVVLDENNEVVLSKTGRSTADEIIEQVRKAKRS
jgi:thiol-disulfide isomerase/thioredoxin